MTENVTANSKEITLDLGSKTVTGTGNGTVLTINGGDVTLTGDGTITGGSGNNGKHGGGVKVNNDADFTMENGTITGNHVSEQGGGVFIDAGTFTMNGGSITGNTAGFSGGGVFVYNYLESKSAKFVMNGGTISENTANGGGGVGAYGWKQNRAHTAIELNKGIIKNNTANQNGGGVAMECGNAPDYVGNFGATGMLTAEINGVKIYGNTANQGGGVHSVESILKIAGAEITGNTATGANGFGGGLYVQGGNAEVTGAEITGNTAVTGGGLFAGHKTAKTIVKMTSGKLYGNTATNHSADVYVNELTALTLPNAAGMGGKLNGTDITGWFWDGGGEYAWSENYVVERDLVPGATVKQCLRAAYVLDPMAKIVREGKDINFASIQDAIDAAQTGETIIVLKDFIATGNEKPAWDNWLNQVDAAKTPVLTIDLNGHVIDCKDKFGWLEVNSGTVEEIKLTVKNGTVQNASGCNQGSAIWAFKELVLENVQILNCASASYGGAVYVGSSNNTTKVTVTNCVFNGNSGDIGGALAIFMANQVDIAGTTFTNNTASNMGGAFYVDHGLSGVNLIGCGFEGNKATYGGAIFAGDNCKLNVTDCRFTKNTAEYGGAVFAQGNGYTNPPQPGTLAISESVFTGNEAQYGGALYGTILNPSTLENVTITGNSASLYGGALYVVQAPITIRGGKITGNTAKSGGGIINYYAELTLESSAEVHNNTASSLGDDIYSSDAGYHDTLPASLVLGGAADSELLSDGKRITGWFIDGQEGEGISNRWGVDGFYKEFDGVNSVVALKAAHGAYYTVTYSDGLDDEELFPDQAYEVASGTATPAFVGEPVREGYTFTGWSPEVAETVTKNVTYLAQWSQNSSSSGGSPTTYYDLTINYVFEDGAEAAPSHTSRHASGYRYSVTSPVREGYTPDQAEVSGRLTGNVTITVTYTANTTEIPDENPPLVDQPTVDVPEENPPLVEVPEEDVPLTEIPEENVPLTEIPEEKTPLSDVPETGDKTGLWLTFTLGSAFALLCTAFRRKEED